MGQGLANPILKLNQECLTFMGQPTYSKGLQDGPGAEAMYNPNKVPPRERKTASEMPNSHAAFLSITSLTTFISLHRNLLIDLSSVTRLGRNGPFS